MVRTARRVKVQIIHEIADAEPAPSISPIGIDVGIRSRVTCSNGYQTGKNELDRTELKRRQRILSKADQRFQQPQEKAPCSGKGMAAGEREGARQSA